MTSHGTVLLYIAANPASTMREIAETVGITERRTSTIVQDLAQSGMLWVTREGRVNRYSVNLEAHLRHPTLAHVPLRSLVESLVGSPAPEA